MSLFSSIKRAFGIGVDDFDPEEEFILPEESVAESSAQHPEKSGLVSPPAPPADDPLPADILDGVVSLFNSIQPEFVKKCIDTEAQKRYLLESIDSALRARIQEAIVRGHDMGLQQWEEERQSVADEITELRNQKKELELKRDESRNARLSAERQKRALNERVHDLENQILTLEAEKEQLHLENRSMLNKLRVAGVTGTLSADDTSVERMLEELESLKERNTRMGEELAASRTELEACAKDLKAAQTALDRAHADIDTLTTRLAAAEANADEVARLRTLNSDLTAKTDASALLVAELRSQLASSRVEIESLHSTIESNFRANAALLEAVSSDSSAVFDIPVQIPEKAVSADKPETKTRKKKKKTTPPKKEKPRISAIDELMDSTDWLVAPLPEPPKDIAKEDDFGYHAPAPKKNPADTDDRQLSLW